MSADLTSHSHRWPGTTTRGALLKTVGVSLWLRPQRFRGELPCAASGLWADFGLGDGTALHCLVVAVMVGPCPASSLPTPPQPFAHPAPSVPHPCLTLSGQEASRQLTPKPGHAHSHTLGTHFLVVTQNYCCHTRLPGIAQLGVKIIKIKTPTEALKVAPRGMMDSRRRGRHKGLHPTPSTVASHGPRGHRDHQQCCPSLTQTQYFNLSAPGITSIHTLVRKNQAHALCGGHRP